MLRIHELTDDDRASWEPMFRTYAATAGVDLNDARVDRLWKWLIDPDHHVTGAPRPVTTRHRWQRP